MKLRQNTFLKITLLTLVTIFYSVQSYAHEVSYELIARGFGRDRKAEECPRRVNLKWTNETHFTMWISEIQGKKLFREFKDCTENRDGYLKCETRVKDARFNGDDYVYRYQELTLSDFEYEESPKVAMANLIIRCRYRKIFTDLDQNK